MDESLGTIVISLDKIGALDLVWHEGLLKDLRDKSIQLGFIRLLTDHLHDRIVLVAGNVPSSRSPPVELSVSQKSVLELISWNINLNNLLQMLPTISHSADDYTLSPSCLLQDSQRV